MAGVPDLARQARARPGPPAAATDLARSLARRGSEVRVLLRVYLNAHHGVFTYLSDAVDQLASGAPVPEEVLRTIWRRADRWMDESVETLIETFYAERQRELAGSAARRAELVDELLAGQPVDVGQATNSLGHPLILWQLAFLIWTEEVEDRTPTVLQSAAERVAGHVPGARLFTQLSGSRDLRCWVASAETPTTQALAAISATVTCGEGPFDRMSVALGRAARGVEGFRNSHLEARSAQRVAMAATTAPAFIDYSSVELLCLAMADLPALRRMVHREIGPICAGDKSLAAVRETVLAYLRNRMNVETTAERLFVHGNTVRNRLAKAEALLGHPLADRAAVVELALQYVAYFGPVAD